MKKYVFSLWCFFSTVTVSASPAFQLNQGFDTKTYSDVPITTVKKTPGHNVTQTSTGKLLVSNAPQGFIATTDVNDPYKNTITIENINNFPVSINGFAYSNQPNQVVFFADGNLQGGNKCVGNTLYPNQSCSVTIASVTDFTLQVFAVAYVENQAQQHIYPLYIHFHKEYDVPYSISCLYNTNTHVITCSGFNRKYLAVNQMVVDLPSDNQEHTYTASRSQQICGTADGDGAFSCERGSYQSLNSGILWYNYSYTYKENNQSQTGVISLIALGYETAATWNSNWEKDPNYEYYYCSSINQAEQTTDCPYTGVAF